MEFKEFKEFKEFREFREFKTLPNTLHLISNTQLMSYKD